MTKTEMVAILTKWAQDQTTAEAGIEPLYKLLGCNPESPLMETFYRITQAHTDAVALLVGDQDGWLGWFQFDNDMGAKGFEASPPNGKLRKVRNVKNLASLIIESNKGM